MSKCCVVVLLIHLIVVLLLLHFHDEIGAHTFIAREMNIFTHSNVPKQLIILYMVICVIVTRLSKLKQRSINFKLDKSALSLGVLALCTLVTFAGSLGNNINIHLHILSMIISLQSSSMVAILWRQYGQMIVEHNMMSIPEDRVETDCLSSTCSIVMFIIIYNVLIYCYCFVIDDGIHAENAFNISYGSGMILISTLGQIPYYLMPEIGYDLYQRKTDMFLAFFALNVFITYQLLWLLIFQYILHPYFHDICTIICFSLMTAQKTLIPSMIANRKQNKFQSICTDKQDSFEWTKYIASNRNNFDLFLLFVARLNLAGNILYILDIMQFKHEFVNVLNDEYDLDLNEDIGYLLPFYSNSFLPSSPITETLINLRSENGAENGLNMKYALILLQQDLVLFYDKYITSNSSLLNAKLVSRTNGKEMKNKIHSLRNMNVINDEMNNDDIISVMKDIIIIFDKSMMSVSNIIQSLYRGYQFGQ